MHIVKKEWEEAAGKAEEVGEIEKNKEAIEDDVKQEEEEGEGGPESKTNTSNMA